MEKKNEKKILERERKAIFVSASVYERFKKLAEADGRKYSQFLEVLMDGVEGVKKKK